MRLLVSCSAYFLCLYAFDKANQARENGQRSFTYENRGVSVESGTLFWVVLAVAALTFMWLLHANRVLAYRVIGERGFRQGRIHFYLALAGVIWILCIPSGLLLYGVCEFVPTLNSSGELPLKITFVIDGLVVLLIMCSTILARKYKE